MKIIIVLVLLFMEQGVALGLDESKASESSSNDELALSKSLFSELIKHKDKNEHELIYGRIFELLSKSGINQYDKIGNAIDILTLIYYYQPGANEGKVKRDVCYHILNLHNFFWKRFNAEGATKRDLAKILNARSNFCIHAANWRPEFGIDYDNMTLCVNDALVKSNEVGGAEKAQAIANKARRFTDFFDRDDLYTATEINDMLNAAMDEFDKVTDESVMIECKMIIIGAQCNIYLFDNDDELINDKLITIAANAKELCSKNESPQLGALYANFINKKFKEFDGKRTEIFSIFLTNENLRIMTDIENEFKAGNGSGDVKTIYINKAHYCQTLADKIRKWKNGNGWRERALYWYGKTIEEAQAGKSEDKIAGAALESAILLKESEDNENRELTLSSAIKYFELSISNFKITNNNDQMMFCYSEMGYCYLSRSGRQFRLPAIDCYFEGLKLATAMKDGKKKQEFLSHFYHQLGFSYTRLYDDQVNLEAAIGYFMKSIEIRKNENRLSDLNNSYRRLSNALAKRDSLLGKISDDANATKYAELAVAGLLKTNNLDLAKEVVGEFLYANVKIIKSLEKNPKAVAMIINLANTINTSDLRSFQDALIEILKTRYVILNLPAEKSTEIISDLRKRIKSSNVDQKILMIFDSQFDNSQNSF
jgi:hypothetical protein